MDNAAAGIFFLDLCAGAAQVPACRRRRPASDHDRIRIRCRVASRNTWRWTLRSTATRCAEKILIVSSGCHGVEGFAGSGIQARRAAGWRLARPGARGRRQPSCHIHALNPYGFSHLHRTTHENVDLNRNFHDFSKPLPRNDSYREVHPLLLPEQWPPPPDNEAALMELMQSTGVKALQAVVARGQHEFADGLFFGGSEPQLEQPHAAARCCATRPAMQRSWPGSTCTPASGPPASASGSCRANPASPSGGRAPGGDPP